MTSGAVNLTTAPRDAEKLQIIGPFMLKRLMEEATKKVTGDALSEERRQAFLRDPIDKRAKDVLEMLIQIDKAGGGAPAEAPASSATSAPATEDKPARQPRTSGKAATNGTTNGTSNGAASHTGDPVDILKGIAGVIEGVSASMEAMQKTLKSVEGGSKRIDALESLLEQVFKLQHLQMGVILQLAEQSLGAPSADILEQVAADYGSAEKIITSMIAPASGKS